MANTPRAIFRIELCSGEIRHWRYLGADARSQVWWQDVESGHEFSESSLMYAWRILDEENDWLPTVTDGRQ